MYYSGLRRGRCVPHHAAMKDLFGGDGALDCGPCRVRAWRWEDEPSLARHADDREVSRRLRDSFPHPYTREDARRFIGFARGQEPRTTFAIAVDGEAVGGIGLRLGQEVERRSAEIGYWLGRAFWGRGIATAAVRGLTGFAFEAFGLTRVFAVPFENNPASMRVLEKCGYLREGVMRRSVVKDGVVMDQILYAITDEDL